MKTLILSDIHANWHALEAILAKEPYDYLIFLGDAVDFGPNPRECIKFLMNSFNKGRFSGVRGDHDNALAYGIRCRCSDELSRLSTATREWGEDILASKDVGFLRRLPLDSSFTLDGISFHIAHDLYRNRTNTRVNDGDEISEFDLENQFSSVTSDFILVGHSHKPFIRRLGKTIVLNPGSVGQPMDFNPRASYALIEDGMATIKRVRYDIEKTVKDLEKTTLPRNVIARLVSILVVGGLVEEKQYLNPN
jgi:putative phosphoesterase